MQQTSLLAFQSLNPVKLGQRQQQVYEAIAEYAPVNDKQLAELTGIPINVVTPRRGELVKKQVVRRAYIKRDKTGKLQSYWEAVEPEIPA